MGYINDKHRAQLGTLIFFLDNVLLRLQKRSGNKFIAPAMEHNKLAFLDLIEVGDKTKKESLVRRIHGAAQALNSALLEHEISAVFVGVIQFVNEAKASKALPIEDGTHYAYVFQQIGRNIDAMLPHTALEDVPPVKEALRKFIETV